MTQAQHKTRIGRVVSDKMEKTVVVAVPTSRHHPLYKKTVTRLARFKAHCEPGQCREGDLVRIVETRPLSKEKRWRVAEVVTKGEVLEVKPEEVT
jgi:small subunit ribosomal protein S17